MGVYELKMAFHRGEFESNELNKHIYLPLVKEIDIISYLDHFGELASTTIEDEEGTKVTIYSEVTRTVHGKNVLWAVKKSEANNIVPNKNISANTNRFDNKYEAVKVAIQLIGGREKIYDWY